MNHPMLLTAAASLLALAGCGTSPLSLGVMVGDPTGINARYDLNKPDPDYALIGALGLNPFDNDDKVHGHVDIIRHIKLPGDTPLRWYLGIGVRFRNRDTPRIGDDDDVDFGPRVPIGLMYPLEANKGDIFAEIAPGWDFVDETGFQIDWGVGIRFRF